MRSRPSWFAFLLFPAVVIVGVILSTRVGSGVTLFIWLVVLVFIAVGTWQTFRR